LRINYIDYVQRADLETTKRRILNAQESLNNMHT